MSGVEEKATTEIGPTKGESHAIGSNVTLMLLVADLPSRVDKERERDFVSEPRVNFLIARKKLLRASFSHLGANSSLRT